jgi:hypothetical protein
MTVTEGWVHLPAPANSTEDQNLGLLAALKKPRARYMAESWANSYDTKNLRFTGIVVPAEDVVDIAQTVERVVRGKVEIVYDGLHEVTPLEKAQGAILGAFSLWGAITCCPVCRHLTALPGAD